MATLKGSRTETNLLKTFAREARHTPESCPLHQTPRRFVGH
jgi:hypothetical protein